MRLVLVEWVDSYGCSETWEHFDTSSLQPRVMTCQSVGWLAHDGDECKVLIPHVADVAADGTGQGCGDMTIPTKAVLRMADLAQVAQGA